MSHRLTLLDAYYRDFIRHIVAVDQLGFELTATPGYAEYIAWLAALNRQFTRLTQEKLCLVEGVDKLTLHSRWTQKVCEVLGRWVKGV